MSEPFDKAKKVLTGAAALAAAIQVEIDMEHQEVERFTFLGVPVFMRTAKSGTPRVFGVPFPRWIRGPRRKRSSSDSEPPKT